MSKIMKRITAMVLALCLCLSFLGAGAWAEESETPRGDESAAATSEENATADPEAEDPSEKEAAAESSENEKNGGSIEEAGADDSEPVETQPQEAISTQEVASGRYSYNDLTWTLDEDGTLTISGTGEMVDYYDNQPWIDYIQSIKKVVIQMGVSRIALCAFSYCSNMSSITIPSSVTSIGRSAFQKCSSLISINIPSSVTSIGEGAFNDCSSLISISIPSSVTNIGDSAFQNCTSLSSISIPTSVTNIGQKVFFGCYNVRSIIIPSSVTSIGDNAFTSCINLTNITIPSSVTSIGDYTFSACHSLRSIIIPSSVTSIGLEAFQYIDNLTIKGEPGSRAQLYASENNIPFEAIGDQKINIASCDITVTSDGTVTVKNGSTVLTAGKDYKVIIETITGSDNTIEKRAIVMGIGNYTGDVAKTFYIRKATPTLCFSASYVTKTYGDPSFTNSLTKITDGTVSFSSSNSSVATVDSYGQVTINGVGTTTITATASEGTNYTSGSASYTLTVQPAQKAAPTLYFSSTSVTKWINDASFTNPLMKTTDGTITYSSSNSSVARVNNSGQVTINGAGTTTITATASEGANYTSGTASYTLTVQRLTPVLRFSSSNITKAYGDSPFTNYLTAATDGTVTFSSSNSSVATVDNNGQVTIKGTGSTTITVTVTAGVNYASGSASYTLTVQKAQPTLRFASSSVSKTYGDSAFTNTLTQKTDGTLTFTSSDTNVAEVNSSGQVTINDTGSVTITVTATEGTNYHSGSASYTLTVYKASSALKFASNHITKTYGDTSFTNNLTNKSNSSVRYSSSDTSVATVNSYGTVTIVGAGTTSITASVSTDDNFDSGVAYYTLTVEKAKNKVTASNIKKTASGSKLSFKIGAKAKGGAEFDYKCSEKSVDISDAGKVTVPAGYAGKFTVTIKTKETDNYYSASKKITVEIVPPKVLVKSLTSPQKKWIKVAWKAAKGISGYQLEVSESKNFKSGKQKKSKISAQEKDVTMSGLKSKTIYYARMRTYKKNGPKTYYGAWSAVKSVKVK